jgi:uncharacterized membrane protein
MSLNPVIAIHLSAALAATALGPLALWARRGRTRHPRLHRAFGYAWVTLMIFTAVSAIFIQGSRGPRFHGYSLIHLLIPTVFVALFGAFWYLSRRNVAGHRRVMQITYLAGCIVAGGFALLPDRYLGNLLWSQWLQLA